MVSQAQPNTACTPLRHALSGSQGGLVGLLPVGTACARPAGSQALGVAWSGFRQSGTVASRPPVPRQRTPGHNASRWAAPCITLIIPKGITKDILVSTI